MLLEFTHDARYAARVLRAHALFTATAALWLAVGIGANATIFSVASAMLPHPSRAWRARPSHRRRPHPERQGLRQGLLSELPLISAAARRFSKMLTRFVWSRRR